MRKTKILATMGPACNSVETIKTMIQNGLNAARINFSHADHAGHSITIANVKAAREAMGVPLPILLDTKGPEIRTKVLDDSCLTDGKLYLKEGQEFTLTTEDIIGDATRVAVTYESLARDLQVGHRVMIDDGKVEMVVESKTDTEVRCRLVNAGPIGNRKGVNLPDVKTDLPALTQQDMDDIAFGVQQGVDYVAASFVRTAEDVQIIRKVLKDCGGEHVLLISKIENQEGIDNLDAIIEASDGIMVARGDLGIEILPEDVPMWQKEIIYSCNISGKLVITATHMLESMQDNPRPTRAEVSDVANAVLDGTDVVMLSGETANGKYPAQSVLMMARVAEKAEALVNYTDVSKDLHDDLTENTISTTDSISQASVRVADELEAACIVPLTVSGFTARMVSRARPNTPILAVTDNAVIQRQMNLLWGCTPVLTDKPFEGTSESDIFAEAEKMATKHCSAKGKAVVVLAGMPIGVSGTTNSMKVLTVN